MLTNQLIDKFYKDVNSLGLKFPVAAIAKETGYSKGNVSNYLKGSSPSENFIKAFYAKFSNRLEKVSRETPTTRTETPQISPKSIPDHSDTRTEIGKLVARIKAETGLIIEDIADKIGVSRPYLTDLGKHGRHSETIYRKLQEEFKDVLNDMTTSTKPPAFEMKPNGEKDATIFKQADTINKHADTLKSQQELIAELAKNVMHLSGKLIEKR